MRSNRYGRKQASPFGRFSWNLGSTACHSHTILYTHTHTALQKFRAKQIKIFSKKNDLGLRKEGRCVLGIFPKRRRMKPTAAWDGHALLSSYLIIS